MRNLVIRLFSSTLLATTLGVGFVHAASISDTGPHSRNQIVISNRSSVRESSDTNVNVSNSNHQSARTGNATVSGNTRGGDATTGNATNNNSQSTSVSVSSPARVDHARFMPEDSNASITDTGPHSTNQIVITNNSSVNESMVNDVSVSNHNSQSASTGNAVVSHNTWGGDATTGDATNSNWQSTDVSITGSGSADLGNGSAANLSSGNGWGSGVQANHHQTPAKHPTKSDDGWFGRSQFVAVAETTSARQNCDHAAAGFDRHPVRVEHVVHRIRTRDDQDRGPCEVVNCRTIRPPCQRDCDPPQRRDDCHHRVVRHCGSQHQDRENW